MHPCHGLYLYTNNNTIIEVKLNTPMNTSTHSSSDIRTNVHTDIIPANTNHHVSISINANTIY